MKIIEGTMVSGLGSDRQYLKIRKGLYSAQIRKQTNSILKQQKRDRSLITVATLVALYRINELPFHLNRALENGVTKNELIELITHLAFYAGWPAANTAVSIARKVFAESGDYWADSSAEPVDGLIALPSDLDGT